MKGNGGKKKNQVSNDDVEPTSNAVDNVKRVVGGDGEPENNRDGEPLFLREVIDDEGGRGDRGEDGGEEVGEDEVEEERDGEGDGDEDEDEEGQEERPKLDEGFFEIEAIRRKRVRKGQLQYLIKWRGWPETANTWEPLENLQSCSDFIDAFEDSLRSGRHGRKRKRKSGGFHSQPKKKQPRLTSVSHNATDVNLKVFDKPLTSELPNNSNLSEIPAWTELKCSNHKDESNGDDNNVNKTNQVDENGVTTGLKQIDEKKEENEYDPKLSELRGTQECKAFEGDDLPNGLPKVGSKDTVHSSRSTGARRRKSGSVKRFKQDATLDNPVLHQSSTQDITLDSFGTIARLGTDYPGVTEHSSSQKHKTEELDIMKILKPISFSASLSDGVQDVLVTFMALRSDGKQVMVDNRFLKAHNPLLLIDFYEQHLKYDPTS